MYLEIYPDIIFVLNFFIDYILLFLLSRINRKRSNWKRLSGASAIGAGAAVVLGVFPWMNIIIRILFMNVAASVLMLRIAFGKMTITQLLKQLIALYLITYFVGGFINSIYYYTDFREKLIHIGSSFLLSNLSWKLIIGIMLLLLPMTFLLLKLQQLVRSEQKETYEVELIYDGRSIHTTGLLDTGNHLYDPIYRKPVMVIEEALVKEFLTNNTLFDLEEIKKGLKGRNESFDSFTVNTEHVMRFRLIPYRCVGKLGGIMPGLIFDKVLIHTGKETICNEKVTAAICDNRLSSKDDYHVLLHKELI